MEAQTSDDFQVFLPIVVSPANMGAPSAQAPAQDTVPPLNSDESEVITLAPGESVERSFNQAENVTLMAAMSKMRPSAPFCW